jgi:hypothetical protein
MLLTSGQCQTLPSPFSSFFFKFGDRVETGELQVFREAACEGPAESESTSLTQFYRCSLLIPYHRFRRMGCPSMPCR